MLNLGTTAPPCPAFVHTVWPCGKKPRPISQEIPIQSLKTFRATMLVRHKKSKEDLDEECYWEPSPNTWMYGQEHLLAILDVDTQRTAVNRGHFFLTPASEEMILKVQSEEHPAAPHRGLNVKKRRKPPKLKLGAALKKAASAKIAKKAQEAPTPSSIRRSVAGRRMVRFMMKKALEVDAVRFADNPVFNPNTGSCTLKGCTSYTYDLFMEQVPLYFQDHHRSDPADGAEPCKAFLAAQHHPGCHQGKARPAEDLSSWKLLGAPAASGIFSSRRLFRVNRASFLFTFLEGGSEQSLDVSGFFSL